MEKVVLPVFVCYTVMLVVYGKRYLDRGSCYPLLSDTSVKQVFLLIDSNIIGLDKFRLFEHS